MGSIEKSSLCGHPSGWKEKKTPKNTGNLEQTTTKKRKEGGKPSGGNQPEGNIFCFEKPKGKSAGRGRRGKQKWLNEPGEIHRGRGFIGPTGEVKTWKRMLSGKDRWWKGHAPKEKFKMAARWIRLKSTTHKDQRGGKVPLAETENPRGGREICHRSERGKRAGGGSLRLVNL